MVATATLAKHERGTVLMVIRPDQPPVSLFVPTELMGSEMAYVAADIVRSMTMVESQATGLGARLKDEVFHPEMKTVLGRTFGPVFRSTQAQGLELQRDQARADATLRAIPDDPASVARQVAFQEVWRSLDAPGKAARLPHLTLAEIQAIMAVPLGDTGTPPEFAGPLADAHLKLAIIKSAGLEAEHARRPDANDPLASGLDRGAALVAAEDRIAEYRARRSIVDLTRSTLLDMVNVSAALADIRSEEAFAMLSGEPA